MPPNTWNGGNEFPERSDKTSTPISNSPPASFQSVQHATTAHATPLSQLPINSPQPSFPDVPSPTYQQLPPACMSPDDISRPPLEQSNFPQRGRKSNYCPRPRFRKKSRSSSRSRSRSRSPTSSTTLSSHNLESLGNEPSVEVKPLHYKNSIDVQTPLGQREGFHSLQSPSQAPPPPKSWRRGSFLGALSLRKSCSRTDLESGISLKELDSDHTRPDSKGNCFPPTPPSPWLKTKDENQRKFIAKEVESNPIHSKKHEYGAANDSFTLLEDTEGNYPSDVVSKTPDKSKGMHIASILAAGTNPVDMNCKKSPLLDYEDIINSEVPPGSVDTHPSPWGRGHVPNSPFSASVAFTHSYDSFSPSSGGSAVDWTPEDSSYGAACPVCGCLPKRFRRLIEFSLYTALGFILIFVVVMFSIKLTEDVVTNNTDDDYHLTRYDDYDDFKNYYNGDDRY
eukprot:CAMPEP_0194267428 /NCGR_PEP_ID=MMETSP0169-20130528/1930_1 /TAXON_ID=218684 /ORGANISM="Corethron pennatum, Strain L29A3" /LENGTH=451 /DNA_ID=CAMNT_0039008259 /DNA_START=260 /DNA_END=1615 /DNA_ORIENTATION=-